MADPVPHVSKALFGLFGRYSRWYVRKHFHALRVAGRPPELGDGPAVIYLNHPSWWDPLVAIVLATHFWPGREHYAPIEAAALRRYQFFERLGFFGIEKRGHRGAVTFLKTSQAILEREKATLWVTAGGEFRDPRDRPVPLRPGIAHLAKRTKNVRFVPLALEYPFWQEKLPEALVHFGEPVRVFDGAGSSVVEYATRFEMQLEAAMDALAMRARRQRAEDFELLLKGSSGVGGLYDVWRAARARLGGKTFDPEHKIGGGPS